MEVSNAALTALFDAAKNCGYRPEDLLVDTDLSYERLRKPRGKHTWAEFCEIYRNLVSLISLDETSKQIADTGINNEDVSIFKNIAMGIVTQKFPYWFQAKLSGPYLFKNVDFNYKKITKRNIQMEIKIHDGYEDLPELFHAYTKVFENFPTVAGFPKAIIKTDVTDNKAIYHIQLAQNKNVFIYFKQILNIVTSYKASIELLNKFDEKNYEYELLNDKLAKEKREKEKLLNLLCHDMGNSIMSLNFVTRCLNRTELDEYQQKQIGRAILHTNKLGSLLESVKMEHKQSASSLKLNRIDIFESLNNVLNTFQERLLKKNMTTEIKNEVYPHHYALANATTLENHVLSNIISNCIKFSHPGSKLKFHCYVENFMIHLDIYDEGVGMDEKKRESLFKNVKNESTLGTDGEQGTGLGMSIVKRYIDMYNGRIEVTNNEPQGTIFMISLKSSIKISESKHTPITI